MTDFSLTSEAENDLAGIYFYTLQSFGYRRADAYVADLKQACLMLAERPTLGRSFLLLAEIKRHEHASHVIFFREVSPGHILVVRILGFQQEPGLHLMDQQGTAESGR